MHHKKLAIIDDDDAYLRLLSRLLEQEGYEARMFAQLESSAAAYEGVRAFGPAVIVLDIALDRPATGWQTLNFLRLDPALERTPIVVCSANLRALQEREWYLKTKGCAILPKPYYLSDLLAALAQFELADV